MDKETPRPSRVCKYVSLSPVVFNSLGIGLILNVLPDSAATISPCLPLAFIRAMIYRIQHLQEDVPVNFVAKLRNRHEIKKEKETLQ